MYFNNKNIISYLENGGKHQNSQCSLHPEIILLVSERKFRKFQKCISLKVSRFILVTTCLRGKFGINLPSSLFWNFEIKILKNEQGKFSQNFTNKHVIPGSSHVKSSQRAHKGKNYTKINQSISTNLINITP